MNKHRIMAVFTGGNRYPDIKGAVTFTPHLRGSMVSISVSGLPDGFHGFHLHSMGKCEKQDDFSSAGGHYNPSQAQHPNHAGDFPNLLSSGGIAQMEFYTDRFTPQEAAGKAVIIHEKPDDFSSQPAGNSGERIACAVVEEY